jgi:hypothetical protein
MGNSALNDQERKKGIINDLQLETVFFLILSISLYFDSRVNRYQVNNNDP